MKHCVDVGGDVDGKRRPDELPAKRAYSTEIGLLMIDLYRAFLCIRVRRFTLLTLIEYRWLYWVVWKVRGAK